MKHTNLQDIIASYMVVLYTVHNIRVYDYIEYIKHICFGNYFLLVFDFTFDRSYLCHDKMRTYS
jgi:hypothetical protein